MIVRISNLDASPLYYSTAVIPASCGLKRTSTARHRKARKLDRARSFPIVTRNALSLRFALSSFSLITERARVTHTHVPIRTYVCVYVIHTHVCVHANAYSFDMYYTRDAHTGARARAHT